MLHLGRKIKLMSTLLILSVLVGCTDRNAKVEVNDAVKAGKEEKEIKVVTNDKTINLSTTKAIDKINFVDKKKTDFWNVIENNFIDIEYNEKKVKKSNIRLMRKANEAYINAWIDELKTTYKYVLDLYDGKEKDLIKKQYDSFLNYIEATKVIYSTVLTTDNSYSNKIDGNHIVKLYYYLADEVREYTILLKEYIYLENGEVFFYTQENDAKKTKTKFRETTDIISLKICTDNKFQDIIYDKYKEKIDCNIKDYSEKKALKKIKEYNSYWKEEVKNNYTKLKKSFNKTNKKILELQKEKYLDYATATYKLQNKIFDKKNKEKHKGRLYVGEMYIEYNILLIEYSYLLNNKIDI